MKRRCHLCILLSLVLLTLCSCACISGFNNVSYADSKLVPYQLPGTDYTISLPDNFYYVTRGMDADDPVLDALGLTAYEVNYELLSDEKPLMIVSPDQQLMIQFSFGDHSKENFNLYTDEEQLDMMDTGLAQFEKIDVFHHDPYVFLRLWNRGSAAQYGVEMYGLTYYTVRDYERVGIAAVSYRNSLTTEEEALMERIVSTLTYTAE